MDFLRCDMRPATPSTRRVLLAAGAFNLGAALALPVLARLAPAWLGLDPPSLSQRMYIDLFAALVLTIGLGYALAGLDLPRWWPIVALGILGKALVVLIAWGYFVAGGSGLLPAVLAGGDALFAILFYRVLRRQAREPTGAP